MSRHEAQLFFGVAGPDAGHAAFGRLRMASSRSNPASFVASITDHQLQLGHASRAFAWWTDGPASFALDGEIRWIDGSATVAKGHHPDDRAKLAALFRSQRDRAWERLDGSFCLAVSDADALELGVDPAGARAVYWWADGETLLFHSHLLDLVAGLPGGLSADLGAIGHFLASGSYPPESTPFREIRHLGAGQWLRRAAGRVQVREHFSMASDTGSRRSDTELVDGLIERMGSAIEQGWRVAAGPVVPLSGGLDSRYLAAELVALGGRDAVRTITWGVDRGRAGGDGVIAARVAATLGIENTWYEKEQRHTPEAFERAIYLSSGEADCAIHFPDDHELHATLAHERGFASLFRGDECFGATRELITDRAILAVNGIGRLDHDDGYRDLVPGDLLDQMADEQAAVLADSLRGLTSRSPTGRRDEIYYSHRVRRLLAPYNRVKNAHLETYTPYLDRAVLDWVRSSPDRLRSEKALLQRALERRHPAAASIPFATADNLPRWDERASRDPGVARFYREWCESPGWLDAIGAREAVLTALAAVERNAVARAADEGVVAQSRSARWIPRRAAAAGRRVAKGTWPGRLLREATLERRSLRNNLPPYLRLARLAVLHRVLGQPTSSSEDPRIAAVSGSRG